MRKLQLVGLSMFSVGFAIFLISIFIPNYEVTSESLEVIPNENKRALFLEKAKTSLNEQYTGNFKLISDLQSVFERVNLSQQEKYSINKADKAEIVAAYTLETPFSLQILEEVFVGEEEVSKFKLSAFQEYGSWLEGRNYAEASALSQDIHHVAKNISIYAITNKFGFDKYEIKNLKYEITRIASNGWIDDQPGLFLWLTYGLCIIGGLLYILPNYWLKGEAGIKNDGIYHSKLKNRGWLGIALGIFLIAFYVILYFFPEYMTPWIITVDPISFWIKNSEAGRFFLYGFIYTLCILVMGVRMILHYRHSKYQILRTLSVMFFQTAFAFTIPEILIRLNKPYFDFKNIWPLDYDFFFDNELQTLLDSGTLGIFMLGWGIGLIILGVPVLVYFFGKRWYCSWVCGCGGLAETLGDPFRHLSDKSLNAWKIERWMIHSVLVFAVIMTAAVLYTYWTGESRFLGMVDSYQLRSVYGAWIGAGFAGVVGTGFYPLMGNRVWCRFGCPLAAYLGIIQRFKSRFRITTNGGQCISCGNCSTYCEMGIDVRWYAQRGQNIVRSSCVGCGICSAVCPRGVLKLENGKEEGRFGNPILIGNDSIDLKA